MAHSSGHGSASALAVSYGVGHTCADSIGDSLGISRHGFAKPISRWGMLHGRILGILLTSVVATLVPMVSGRATAYLAAIR